MDIQPVHPWIRYFARMLDLYIFMFVFCVITILIEAFFPSFSFYSFFLKNNLMTIFVFISWVVWVFVEPIFLKFFGTTPGKFIFNTFVINRNGEKLTYKTGLIRSFNVLYKGLGFYIPIVSLATLLSSHTYLTKNKTTKWDEISHSEVKHGVVGIGRLIIIVILVGLFLYLVNLGNENKKSPNSSNSKSTINNNQISSNWIEYHSDKGRFLALFPSKPIEKQSNEKIDSNSSYDYIIADVTDKNGNEYFVVRYSYFGVAIENKEISLNAIIQGMIDKTKDKVIKVENLKYKNFFAKKAILYDSVNSSYSSLLLFVFDKSNIYMLGFNSKNSNEESFDKFVNSFKLVN